MPAPERDAEKRQLAFAKALIAHRLGLLRETLRFQRGSGSGKGRR
jgi:hypothetical protein